MSSETAVGRGKRPSAPTFLDWPEGKRKCLEPRRPPGVEGDCRGATAAPRYRQREGAVGSGGSGKPASSLQRVDDGDRARLDDSRAMCHPDSSSSASLPGVYVPFLLEVLSEKSETPSSTGGAAGSPSSRASSSPGFANSPHRRIVALHFAAVSDEGVSEDPQRIEVHNDSLQNAFDQFTKWLPANALVVSTAQAIRQTLFPISINRNGVQPPVVFQSFVNIEKCATGIASESPETDLRQMCKLIEMAQQQDVPLVAHIEEVKIQLEQSICFDTTSLEPDVVVRARGLPWQASDQDVANFFAGLNIAPGGVALCLSAEGRRNGEALVRFDDATQRTLALQRNRHFLNNRYIEVYRASSQDFLRVAVGSSLEAMNFVNRSAGMIIRMRGLPYDCTEAEIREFFRSEESPAVEVIDQGILFVNKADGRPSGDAFVLFADEESGSKALQKDRCKIGNRYIELFRSTQAEVQQVVSKSQQSPPPNGGQNVQRKDCIRLRGLPYEAQVSNIVEFLGQSARHIVYQGVHMVFNKQGHPSGEAFIQMDSEASAASAAFNYHNKYMVMGKKKRYIEVFQCSPDDMNLIVAPPSPMMVPNQPIYQGTPPAYFSTPVTSRSAPGVLTPSNPIMSGYPQAYWPHVASGAPQMAPFVFPPGMVYLPPEVLSQMSHLAPMGIAPDGTPMLGNAPQLHQPPLNQNEALLRYRNRLEAERMMLENPQASIHLSLIHT
ncbi:hypothetical protein L596_008193 [Steinernema carpocapsae]|uniref:RRM domain-containing protein n=1 Tax=Steinernema carpocapsae TaxID=34508 RepID=A0A4U5PC84_STECR|nr:hypothetical protein L596_008193 [Steinernema carpocapsae]